MNNITKQLEWKRNEISFLSHAMGNVMEHEEEKYVQRDSNQVHRSHGSQLNTYPKLFLNNFSVM